jgi:hypothetical protein
VGSVEVQVGQVVSSLGRVGQVTIGPGGDYPNYSAWEKAMNQKQEDLHEETHIYDSCAKCPHRLRQMLTGCDIKDMRSRIIKRYRSRYFILRNNKGIKRFLFCSVNQIKKVLCDKLTDKHARYHYGPVIGNSKLPSKEEFDKSCMDDIRRFYKRTWYDNLPDSGSILKPSPHARKVVEVIDVTECLTVKEKFMFRKDFYYNRQIHSAKRRWLWAHRWWDKYYDQAVKITEGFRPEDEKVTHEMKVLADDFLLF